MLYVALINRDIYKYIYRKFIHFMQLPIQWTASPIDTDCNGLQGDLETLATFFGKCVTGTQH